MCVLVGGVLNTWAQTVYPYFPDANVKGNLVGVATSVDNPSTLVVNQSQDFTLEVNATANTPVKIADGISVYEYLPASTSTVRFVKKASVVYVYEGAVYKTSINSTSQLEFPAIRLETDDKTNQKGIYNPANLIANPGFETRVTQGTSTTHYKDGTYWNTYNDLKAADWGTGTNTSIRSVSGYYSEGSYSLIFHSSSRYLTQNLGKLKPNTYYQISYDYWTSSPSSNGGATYNILLGTEQFSGNTNTLVGHTTSSTETTKKSFTGIFKSPETLPDADIWLTFHRPVSKVDWFDRISLLESSSTNSAAGISGVSGAVLYVAGTAYAPEISLNTSAGDYVEMTSFITNPSFENGTTGWTNNGMATQTNTSFGSSKNGNTYVEKWVSSPPLPNVSVTQTLTGLPNGKYTLKAAAQNILQNPLSGKPGAFLFANDSETEVGDKNDYSADFLVIDGTASIGFKTLSSQANWTALDNFRLQYKGFGAESMKARLQVLKDTATVLLGKKMQNTVRTPLASASDAAQVALDNPNAGNELADVLLQLQNSVNAARTSIAYYTELQNAINAATVVYGDGSGKDAAILLSVIQKNETLVNNLDAFSDDLKNGTVEINAAVLAYRVANASGAQPVVVTDPNFARGATMAFGRSTISGMAVSDLLEHGFCWSTNPEPTIFDNKTTKYLSNNGFIYKIENLEPSTIYYMRAYAISKSYTVGYGNVLKVITIPKGTVTYQLNSSVTNSGEHYPRISAAVSSAVNYWNNLTSIKNHHLSVNYNAGTPTAEASYGGYMQFGANSSYQRTGTAIHEMLHTIGVGQHSMWYGPNSPLRATGSGGAWLGERANKIVQFIDNDPAGYLRGDGVHMWPYGINGAHEDTGSELLYIAASLIAQALGEDGLPPTGGFATPAYTLNQKDGEKYYIKVEDESLGRNSTFLSENALGQLANRVISPTSALAADSAAWYLKFDPVTGYYQIKNAATGKYFTYQAAGENGIALTSVSTPGIANAFQLMGARYNIQIGTQEEGLLLKAYWIIRPEAKLNPACLSANSPGSTSAVALINRNDATAQRWLFLSQQEVSKFDNMIVLPVSLTKFGARLKAAEVHLDWSTSAEKNSLKFEVERSTDGKIFHPVGVVSAAGNSSTLRNYLFTDKQPVSGITYYRLKQTDTDGAFFYSGIEAVKVSLEQQNLSCYPNPTSSSVYISGLNQTGSYTYIVYNTSGLKVSHGKIQDGKINLSELSDALYTIQVNENGKKVLIQKVIVRK